ncbi:putative nephrocystin-4 [Paratrimastix pyriformis]|uniref:Nephrocystin-4 n=1 Tax=Paratrimastix pyriformis TaxID=342808 RepID=A0ABQ8UHD2_9EUKA|nr:putative nephrocystin-4 [Paratrimastix pyriformis]
MPLRSLLAFRHYPAGALGACMGCGDALGMSGEPDPVAAVSEIALEVDAPCPEGWPNKAAARPSMTSPAVRRSPICSGCGRPAGADQRAQEATCWRGGDVICRRSWFDTVSVERGGSIDSYAIVHHHLICPLLDQADALSSPAPPPAPAPPAPSTLLRAVAALCSSPRPASAAPSSGLPEAEAEAGAEAEAEVVRYFGTNEQRMAAVAQQRARKKMALLESLVRGARTHTEHLHAAFGEGCFFEVPLGNGTTRPARYQLAIEDDTIDEVGDELRVVVDNAQASYLRHLFGTETAAPLELANLTTEPDTPTSGAAAATADAPIPTASGPMSLVLQPGERVALPFFFQSLCAGDVAPPESRALAATCPALWAQAAGGAEWGQAPCGPPCDEECPLPHECGICPSPPLRGRIIRVRVTDVATRRVALHIDVVIHPRPFAVDRSFRLVHGDSEPVRARFALEHWPAPREGERLPSYKSVRFCHTRLPFTVETATTTNGGCPAPGMERLYIALYSDQPCAALAEVWELCFHARTKVDMAARVGETTRVRIAFGPLKGARVLRCVADSDAIRVTPSEFPATSMARSELTLTAKPMAPGHRFVQLNATVLSLDHVDIFKLPVFSDANPSLTPSTLPYAELQAQPPRELLAGWLVAMPCELPEVTKSMEARFTVGRSDVKGVPDQFWMDGFETTV